MLFLSPALKNNFKVWLIQSLYFTRNRMYLDSLLQEVSKKILWIE